MYAGNAGQVITDYKIENPNSQLGEGERGPVTLPEVWQDGHVFLTSSLFAPSHSAY
jgi:hypothetical protein